MSAPPGRGAAPASADDGRPPLGGWGRLYALVIAALAADVLLLLWLTDRFR